MHIFSVYIYSENEIPHYFLLASLPTTLPVALLSASIPHSVMEVERGPSPQQGHRE